MRTTGTMDTMDMMVYSLVLLLYVFGKRMVNVPVVHSDGYYAESAWGEGMDGVSHCVHETDSFFSY